MHEPQLMIEQFAGLEPIKSKEQLDTLIKLAAEDRHTVVNPTDLVVKNGEIVGYLSIANTPIVIGYFSTKAMRARDSFNLVQVTEQLIRRMGNRNVVWPIGESSPFHKYFPEMGYKTLSLEPITLFIKEL